jgi:hypothetical protein
MRITEPILILPALFIISENPGISTSELIVELEHILNPSGEDAEILSGRSDTKFSQLVRNLVSHKTLERFGYATYTSGESRATGVIFQITETGKSYLDENQDSVNYLFSHGFPYDEIVESIAQIAETEISGKRINLIDEDLLVHEGLRQRKNSIAYERSNAVRRAAIEFYRRNDGHLVCSICDFDFYESYGDDGKDFIEIHHEKPLYETEGEDRIIFLNEAVLSVKPVCSNCHRIIHRNKREARTITEMNIIIKRSE